MRWRALCAAMLVGGLMVPASPAAADDVRVLALHDPRIIESSGLVDFGRVLVTANDSGNPPKLFTVSPATGRTVSVTDFHAKTVDVEALAPARAGAVWVGDIGDNLHTRKFLSVHRAPLPLSSAHLNRLQPVGHVLDFATDAAMPPDGRHVLVRGPGRASVYTLPRFQRIGTFALPRQRQGEGVSVGPGSRIMLSSEGVHSAVRRVSLPAPVVQRMNPTPSPTPTPSASASTSPSVSASPSASTSPSAAPSPDAGSGQKGIESASKNDRWLMWSIPSVIVLGAVGIGLGLRRRSE